MNSGDKRNFSKPVEGRMDHGVVKRDAVERMPFLPVNRGDLEARGWDGLDFLFVSGDAYVDHPSFAAALIG